MSVTPPLLCPIYLPGQEPYPAGTTSEEKQEFAQMQKYQRWMGLAMESCALKVVMSGGAGGFVRNVEGFVLVDWYPPRSRGLVSSGAADMRFTIYLYNGEQKPITSHMLRTPSSTSCLTSVTTHSRICTYL
jgi:hypothetical protein